MAINGAMYGIFVAFIQFDFDYKGLSDSNRCAEKGYEDGGREFHTDAKRLIVLGHRISECGRNRGLKRETADCLERSCETEELLDCYDVRIEGFYVPSPSTS